MPAMSRKSDGRRREENPRWQRRPDERPAEILAAALDTFVERGYAATRLDDVARRAGVTKGTLYLYFANKEELFKATVHDSIVPELERAEQQIAADKGPTRALLERYLRWWWDVIGRTRLSALPKLVMSESANFPELARFYYEEVVIRGRRLLEQVIRRGIERREFREVDPEYAVRVIMSPLVLATVWKHSMVRCSIDPVDLDRHLNQAIDLLMNGLLASGEEGAPGA